MFIFICHTFFSFTVGVANTTREDVCMWRNVVVCSAVTDDSINVKRVGLSGTKSPQAQCFFLTFEKEELLLAWLWEVKAFHQSSAFHPGTFYYLYSCVRYRGFSMYLILELYTVYESVILPFSGCVPLLNSIGGEGVTIIIIIIIMMYLSKILAKLNAICNAHSLVYVLFCNINLESSRLYYSWCLEASQLRSY